jgi:hypothetical protein
MILPGRLGSGGSATSTDFKAASVWSPSPIAPAMLRDVAPELPGDADQQIGWCVLVSTGRCAKAGFKKMFDAAMKKEKPSLAERAAIFAMMPIIERKVVDRVKKAQQLLLYQLVLDAQEDLSKEQKAEKVNAYKQRLGLNDDFKIGDGDKDKGAAPAEQAGDE